jgi:hypothetical protein
MIRAMLAVVLAAIKSENGTAEAVAVKAWPGDQVTRMLVTRAASAPASLGVAGWASELVPNIVGAFVAGIAPQSAAVQLFELAIKIDMTGLGTVSIPRASPGGPQPAWISEGGPIPVAQPNFLPGNVLGPPKKLAFIEALTNELAGHSIPVAEQIIRQLMTEAAAKALDASVFSATAASATRPAGILVGAGSVAPTATSGNVTDTEAAATDFGNLVDAIVAAGGSGKGVVIAMSPGRAAQSAVLAPGLALTRDTLTLIGSAAIPSTQIIAIDAAGGLVSGFSGLPDISVSRDAVLHFEDQAPLDVGTPGAPPTVAAPAKSLFQSDSFGLRCIVRGAWQVRYPGAVQQITGVTW